MSEIISSEKAPKAIGPYSQAVSGRRSGFFERPDPNRSGDGKSGGGKHPAPDRTRARKYQSSAGRSGLSLSAVVKTTVFLKNLSDFSQMNEIYSKYFAFKPPARSTVEVSRLPRDVQVEIDAIAVQEKRTS